MILTVRPFSNQRWILHSVLLETQQCVSKTSQWHTYTGAIQQWKKTRIGQYQRDWVLKHPALWPHSGWESMKIHCVKAKGLRVIDKEDDRCPEFIRVSEHAELLYYSSGQDTARTRAGHPPSAVLLPDWLGRRGRWIRLHRGRRTVVNWPAGWVAVVNMLYRTSGHIIRFCITPKIARSVTLLSFRGRVGAWDVARSGGVDLGFKNLPAGWETSLQTQTMGSRVSLSL